MAIKNDKAKDKRIQKPTSGKYNNTYYFKAQLHYKAERAEQLHDIT